MLRWFSLRRIIFWSLLLGGILLTFVFLGRSFHQSHKRKHQISRLDKAHARLHEGGTNEPQPYQGVQLGRLNSRVDTLKQDHDNDSLVPWGIILPSSSSWKVPPSVTEGNFGRVFQMRTFANIQSAFFEYQNIVKAAEGRGEASPSMEEYLWKNFEVVALPSDTRDAESGQVLSPLTLWEKSIRRHVALWYGEYLIYGGKEERHFGLPVCSTIGIIVDATSTTDANQSRNANNNNREYTTKELDELAGSQGILRLMDLKYARHGKKQSTLGLSGPGQGGNEALRLVVKHFQQNRESREDEEGMSSTTIQHQERQSLRIFAKEHFALNTVHHSGVIQPVCYERRPSTRGPTNAPPIMVYPFLGGGDLVPSPRDHLSFRHPRQRRTLLSPDDAFLPRFFRQLVEAVMAIHDKNVLHLDLKPENFVIHGPDRHWFLPWDEPVLARYHLVVVDFGLSMSLEEAQRRECITVGTEVTMAPEQHLCNHRAGRGTDWWAVGAAMWRTRVFWEPTLDETQRDTLLDARCKQWGHPALPDQPFFSEEFRQMMNILLVPNPEERDFGADSERGQALLDMPYLLRGLGPEGRETRLRELAKQNPAQTSTSTRRSVISDPVAKIQLLMRMPSVAKEGGKSRQGKVSVRKTPSNTNNHYADADADDRFFTDR